MCEAYNITKSVVKEYRNKEEFTKDELYDAIKNKGGAMRIRAGYSVKKYLEDLEYDGIFKYTSKNGKYILQS